jgi:hypothetical protein
MGPDHFQYLCCEATCFAHTFEVFISFNSYVAHLLDSKPCRFRWGFLGSLPQGRGNITVKGFWRKQACGIKRAVIGYAGNK